MERVTERLTQLKLGDSLDEATEMGPLIHEAQYRSIQTAIDRLCAHGGEALQCTAMPDLPGYFVPPTLVEPVGDMWQLLDGLVYGNEAADGVVKGSSYYNSQLRVVVTLRADFYDRPLTTPGLAELMRSCMEIVPPLTRAERAKQVKKRDVCTQYGEQARKVLDALLDKYADEGIENIEDIKILKVNPFDHFIEARGR